MLKHIREVRVNTGVCVCVCVWHVGIVLCVARIVLGFGVAGFRSVSGMRVNLYGFTVQVYDVCRANRDCHDWLRFTVQVYGSGLRLKVQVYGLRFRFTIYSWVYGSGLRFRFTMFAEPIVIVTIGCVYILYNIINPYLWVYGSGLRCLQSQS